MALSATVKVYLGLVTNYYDTAPTWSEITSYVEAVDIDRGRTDVNRPFDAGTATIRLNNRTRLFDPLNSTGTYYAYLGKRLQLKIEATYNGTTYPMFRGWVAGWPQDYPDDAKNSIVNLQAFDIMGLLALTDLGSTLLDYKYSQYSVWWPLGSGSSTNITDATGNGRNGVVVSGTNYLVDYAAIVPATTDLSSRAATTNVSVYAPPTSVSSAHNFTYSIWIKLLSSSVAGAIGVNDYTTTAFSLFIGLGDSNLYYVLPDSSLVNLGISLDINTTYNFMLRYDAASGYISIYKDLVGIAAIYIGSQSSKNSPFIQFDPNIAYSHMVYDQSNAWDETELGRVYQAGLLAYSEPTANRIDRLLDLVNFDNTTFANLTTKAVANCYNFNFTGSLIDALQTAANTEYGYLFADRSGELTLLDRYFESTETTSKNVQAIFSDAGDIAYNDLSFEYSGDDLINQAIVITGAGEQALVGNTTSINSYSRRSQSVNTVLASQAEAFALAKFLLAQKPNAAYAASDFTVKPERKPATYYPTLLGLEIGHRVQIVRKPMGIGSNITFTGILNQIKHRITASDWDISLYATPATQATAFFTLDTSALDGTDILGY